MDQHPEAQSDVTFSAFVLSLAQSALMYMGEIPDPDNRAAVVDRSLARHNIDILGVIEAKTRGNLTIEEGKLLQALLCDLRLKFCKQP